MDSLRFNNLPGHVLMWTILSQFFSCTQCKSYLLFKRSFFFNYIFQYWSLSMFCFSSPGTSLMYVLDVLWLSSVTIIFSQISFISFFTSHSLSLLFSLLFSISVLLVYDNICNSIYDLLFSLQFHLYGIRSSMILSLFF